MSKEMVIGSNRHETKVGVLEDDQLVEVYFQRANEYSLAGSIHKGRVTRVLPGMQSAFVDLGLERDTFLYVSDFFEEHPDIDTLSDDKPPRVSRQEPRRERLPESKPMSTPEVIPVAPVAEAAPEGAPVPVNTENAPDFQHDRRGRRSRRRRTRGRGFPENKYAQPSFPSSDASAPAAAAEDLHEEPADDMLILPGESLAKYRHTPSHFYRDEQIAAAELDEQATDTEEGAKVSDSLNEPDDEGDPTPELVGGSEQLGDVQSAVVEPKEEHRAYDPFEIHLVGDVEDESVEPVAADENAGEEDAAVSDRIEIDFNPEPESNNVPFHTGDVLLTEEDALAESENGQEREEDASESEPGEAALDAPLEAAANVDQSTTPQTAAVREQGGRYMHRVSRRMRRKRGRFNQQNNGSDAQATAAAPAPLAEVRVEEPKAEREDRAGKERDDRSSKEDRPLPLISDLLKAGQEIIVQIAKEPLGQKGARITSHIALPGRYVVYMPSVEHLGVSRKIASEEERHRLKKILLAHRVGTSGGFIVRTAGEERTEDEIAADMNFLYNLWLDIRQKAEKKPAPALLHHDLDVVHRILRDQLTDEYKAIWVDNEDMYESVLRFVQRIQPTLVNRVKMYTRQAPIFDAFNITQELEKAMRPKVWLKSGGYIVINQTEALVAIDVNTGKFVGKSNKLEDTIVKTNTEAVKEIVRQIRLRDLGGIIVVDFIDMDERKNRQKVMQTLEEAMRADKAPNKILQFNDFGLVAITRKRVKQSLERTLCAPCPYCEGAGYVKSVQTIISEILVEAQKIARAIEGKDVVLRCHPDVAKTLKSRDNQFLEELEDILSRPVLVRGDPLIHHEKFDLT